VSSRDKVLVMTYTGSQERATAAFQRESSELAAKGYYPTSQVWAPGAYGCAAFILALLLCFVLIGFLVFIYMLIVKPDGRLTVTYELREAPVIPIPVAVEEKTCPQCAERVKAAALVCRYCGHKFSEASQ